MPSMMIRNLEIGVFSFCMVHNLYLLMYMSGESGLVILHVLNSGVVG